MADDGIYTKNADIAAEAGININPAAITVAATDAYVLKVESTINTTTRFNWSDAFTAGLNADVGGILTETGAVACAIKAIKADMDAIGRNTSESMINILRDTYLRNISILRDKKAEDFINAA